MDLDCNIVLPLMHGDGPPAAPPDLDRQHPIYVDDTTGRFWVFVAGRWLPVGAPIDWMKARLVTTLQASDELSINRGGEAGKAESGDYQRMAISSLVPMVAAALHLYDLLDVALAGVKPGDALVFRDGLWRNAQQRMGLDDLTDVDAAEPVAGEGLVKGASGWSPGKPPLVLNDIVDVNAAGAVDRQVLSYSSADGNWHAAIMAMRLDELMDVSASIADENALLVFDGAVWRSAAGHEVPMAECVDCLEDASPGLEPGRYVLTTKAPSDLYRVHADGTFHLVPDELKPPVLMCCVSLSTWAWDGGAYVRASYIPTSVASPVMILPCIKGGCDIPPKGSAYLDLRGVPTIRVAGATTCPPYDPKIVFCIGGCEDCGVYVRDPATGQLVPGGFRAQDVCVAPCPSGPINAAMDAQQAICLLSANYGNAVVGPCSQVDPGTPANISSEMPIDQAFCVLDEALANARTTVDGFNGGQVGPCSSGPVNATMSLQDAICALSAAAAQLLPAPVAATDVTVAACSSGPVNANTTLQDAICQISEAASTRTVAATNVTVTACASGPVNADMNLQDAICALYNDPTVASNVVEMVMVPLSGASGYSTAGSGGWLYYPDFIGSWVHSPSGLFSVDTSKSVFGGHMIKVNPAALGRTTVPILTFFSVNTVVNNQSAVSAKVEYVVGNTAATTLETVAGFERAVSTASYWAPFTWFAVYGGGTLVSGSTYNGLAPRFRASTEADVLAAVQPGGDLPIGTLTMVCFAG